MITLKGVKLDSLKISRDAEGVITTTGDYCLMSSQDKVLAKQTFNDHYSAIKVAWPPDTAKAINGMIELVKRDLNQVLGLEE